jgi:hypothetical protein
MVPNLSDSCDGMSSKFIIHNYRDIVHVTAPSSRLRPLPTTLTVQCFAYLPLKLEDLIPLNCGTFRCKANFFQGKY